MTRLHSEVRMHGDEMRDLGHALESIVACAGNSNPPDAVPEPYQLDLPGTV